MPTFDQLFTKEFIKTPGEHGVIYGTTGSGKTNLLVDIVLKLKHHANETIIWRDYGKEIETLALAQYYPLKFFYPSGSTDEISLKVKNYDGLSFKPISYYRFQDAEDILTHLDRKAINVLSMRRFLLDSGIFSEFWSRFFDMFLTYALQGKLPRPITFAIDEMNNICPARGQGTADNITQANKLTNRIAFSIQNLRAMQTRLLATSHGITAIKKNVRTQFQWVFFKRLNESIDVDIPRLKMTQAIVQGLQPHQVVTVLPSKVYTDPTSNIPYHLKLSKLPDKQRPYIEYNGVFEYVQEKKQSSTQILGDFRKGLAVDLYLRDGMLPSDIADRLGVSDRQVRRYLEGCKNYT
ncbi:MAG: hypothetical protein SVY15_04040 [Halobacteriota archaeon]|nr:hypothetical protein [Halobacteriota archaeon]